MPTRTQSQAAQRLRKRQIADIRASYGELNTMLTLDALNKARGAARQLAAILIRQLTPGVCRKCGCTDLEGCARPCEWLDTGRTACSNCFSTAGLIEGSRSVGLPPTVTRSRKRDTRGHRQRA